MGLIVYRMKHGCLHFTQSLNDKFWYKHAFSYSRNSKVVVTRNQFCSWSQLDRIQLSMFTLSGEESNRQSGTTIHSTFSDKQRFEAHSLTPSMYGTNYYTHFQNKNWNKPHNVIFYPKNHMITKNLNLINKVQCHIVTFTTKFYYNKVLRTIY